MKIQVDVDQAESLKRGINAPNSTIQLEVEPESLTQEQRAALAARLKDGWRADSFGDHRGIGRIPTPDVAGLQEQLNAVVVADTKRAEKEKAERDNRAQIVAEIIQRGPIQGSRYAHPVWFKTLVFDWPAALFTQCYGNRYPHDDVESAIKAAESSIADRVESDHKKALEAHEAQQAEEARLKAEKEQAEALLIDAAAQSIGPEFYRKFKAGLASYPELQSRLNAMECQKFGLDRCPPADLQESFTLTDEEFLVVEKIAKGIPAPEIDPVMSYDETDSEDETEEPDKTKVVRFSWLHQDHWRMVGYLIL